MSINQGLDELAKSATSPWGGMTSQANTCICCGDNHGDEVRCGELEDWADNDRQERERYDIGKKRDRAEKMPMSGVMPMPYDSMLECPEDYEEEDIDHDDMEEDEDDDECVFLPSTPDLRWFFEHYALSPGSQIAVCRTHANHLAALTRVAQGGSNGAKPVGRPSKKPKTIVYKK